MSAGSRERKLTRTDWAVGAWLAFTYSVLLVRSCRDLGYARDEGFYFQAAGSYARWFELLWKDRAAAMAPRAVDAAWGVNHEHPGLIKSLFALSNLILQEKYHLFAMDGTSYRFPAIVLAGLGIALVYVWGTEARGRITGFAAAVALATMPHFFFNAHLACFDVPIVTMWTFAAYAFWRAQRSDGLLWKVLAGVAFGLALDTKHNSWFLPFACGGSAAILVGVPLFVTRRRADVGALLKNALTTLAAMAAIGPLVFYALWPWIWRGTIPRLTDYAKFHLGHEYYNMEYLGADYWKPPMPRGYAWLLTAASVPTITLVLFALGLILRGRALARAVRAKEALELGATDVVWLLGLLMNYVAWLNPSTPIFGGTKHWMTAYPFLALFAGAGFEGAVRAARLWVVKARRSSDAVRFLAEAPLALVTLFFAATFAAPIVETWRSHPFGLAAYTPLVGGTAGGATLGLNRSFWGYSTGSVVGFLNQSKKNSTVYIHDTAGPSWDMLLRDGRLRKDIRGVWGVAGADYALYHHEKHMLGQEYQAWDAFGTVRPAYVEGLDGVPVIWVYARP